MCKENGKNIKGIKIQIIEENRNEKKKICIVFFLHKK